MKIYEYKNCSSCRNAIKYLDSKAIAYERKAIRETPPTITELEQMLKHYKGDLKRLFNTSGQDYRSLNMKDKLPSMSEVDALKLLSKNGNLVKRPFVLTDDAGVVGFKNDEWQERLNI